MATASFSLHFMIPRVQLKKKKAFGVYMLQQNGQKQPVRIRSHDFTRKIVVSEDESRGILCYKDENEELICEGYDEGPRMIQHPSHKVTCLWNMDWDVYKLSPHRKVRILKQSNSKIVPNGIRVTKM